MMLKLFVCFALIATVSCKSVDNNNDNNNNNNNNNKFMVVLKDDSTMSDIQSVMNEIEVTENKLAVELEMKFVSFLFPVVFAKLSEESVERISALQEVAYIERNQLVHMYPISEPTYNTSKWLEHEPWLEQEPWLQESTDRYNLDILDKVQYGCLNEHYDPPNDGTGADIYILDTGINYDHIDFKTADGSSTRAKYGGYDAVDVNNGDGRDCQGHGSHCAGIAGGLTSGVAKNANLYSIRVLGCSGSGSTIGIVNALNYVGTRHNENKDKSDFVASIVSMSLGGGKSSALDNAVNILVAKGVTVVTASGNDGADACGMSPGSAGDNINVGAHSAPIQGTGGCKNPIAYFSNWGTCVDVIAPGMTIMSVKYDANNGFTTMSGTSMACPHVAGVAALLMKEDTSLTPEGLKQKIVTSSVDDIDRSAEEEAVRIVSTAKRLFVLKPSSADLLLTQPKAADRVIYF